MAWWIFVTTNTEDELRKRIDEKSWPIFNHTRHRDDLGKGDQVIIYHGGKFGGKKFVGTFTISSKITRPGAEDYSIKMSKITKLEHPVKASDIIGNLGFIKRKDNWGIYFQGGVSRIPKQDYNTILSASK